MVVDVDVVVVVGVVGKHPEERIVWYGYESERTLPGKHAGEHANARVYVFVRVCVCVCMQPHPLPLCSRAMGVVVCLHPQTKECLSYRILK